MPSFCIEASFFQHAREKLQSDYAEKSKEKAIYYHYVNEIWNAFDQTYYDMFHFMDKSNRSQRSKNSQNPQTIYVKSIASSHHER